MLKIGIDTGGTYTDAVLFDESKGILATGKSTTTHYDLSIGIGNALDKLLINNIVAYDDINKVCLSTTLATNAIVEDKGLNSCLFLIGYKKDFLNRGQLAEGIGNTPYIFLDGGHDAHGNEVMPLDSKRLIKYVSEFKEEVHSFAIASYFATRNNAHEIQAQKLIQSITSKPVTCSYQISSELNAPKRTLTTLFNAKLIPLIDELIEAVKAKLLSLKINAPIMIVQGNGALLNAETALQKPIETILSGPAASVHGARYLSNHKSAIVADIGGTTTDIAIIENGFANINKQGVYVGKWHTLVEAINIFTYGIGGDSEVTIDHNGSIDLKEQRAIPISLLAINYPQIHDTLDYQLSGHSKASDGVFVLLNRKNINPSILRSRGEKDIVKRLQLHSVENIPQPVSLSSLTTQASNINIIDKLRRRGIVNISTFTPTDAAHILDMTNHLDKAAALKQADILCRLIKQQYNKSLDIHYIASRATEKLIHKSALALTESLMLSHNNTHHHEKRFISDSNKDLKDNAILRLATQLDDKFEHIDFQINTNLPVIGTGASAELYYPEIVKRLNTTVDIPLHFEVCNAVGAATANVLRRASALITCPSNDIFQVHIETGNKQFNNLLDAEAYAREAIKALSIKMAEDSGAKDITVVFSENEKSVMLDDYKKMLLEKKIIAMASGTPL